MRIIFSIVIIIIILFFTTKASMEVKDIDNKKIGIKVYLKIMNIIKIPIKINVNKKINIEISKLVKALKKIKQKIKMENIDIDLKFGTDNVILVAYLYAIINCAIALLVYDSWPLKKGKNNVNIEPYFNKNIFYISINCIFSIKIVHIIYIIYVLKRRV